MGAGGKGGERKDGVIAVCLVLLMSAGGAACGQARSEVNFYTSLHEQHLPHLVSAFEKKHGIKVKVWRSGADKVLQRVITEAGAGRFDVDAVFVGSGELEALHREKLLQPVSSSNHQNLLSMPAHREWAPAFLTVWVQAYNTRAVRKEELPRTYQDLRDPRWKGRLGIEAGNDDWFGKLLSEMGEQKGLELFRGIVAVNGMSVRKGHSLLGNLIVSGEVPFAITMHSVIAEWGKKHGAPIDWIALEPLIARANGIGLARKAPHPQAALAFYEFMIGDEGQKLFAERDYVPASRAIDSPLKNANLKIIEPGPALDQGEKWSKLFNEVMITRR
jgi:iron(III) transport system substrate-binding protein